MRVVGRADRIWMLTVLSCRSAVDALRIGSELVFANRGAYSLKVALQRTARDDGWLRWLVR